MRSPRESVFDKENEDLSTSAASLSMRTGQAVEMVMGTSGRKNIRRA